MKLYEIGEIFDLPDKEFFSALLNGQLNNMSVPAKEYFYRQDLIREQVQKRSILSELNNSSNQEYVYQYICGEDYTVEYMVPEWAIGVVTDKASEIRVILLTSKEEYDNVIDHFRHTGNLKYSSVLNGDVDTPVYSILPLQVKGIYRREVEEGVFKKDK